MATVWSILLGALPLLLKIAGLILDKNGADEDEKRAVLDLIVKATDDPLVSIQMKDDFAALRVKLKDRLTNQGPPA